MSEWGSKLQANCYRATVSLTGLSGSTVDLPLSPAAPTRYILLGGYITLDGAPAATDADTDSLQASIVGTSFFGYAGEILAKTEVGITSQVGGFQAGGDLDLRLEAKLGADDPGELSHISGATTATVTLWYLPA